VGPVEGANDPSIRSTSAKNTDVSNILHGSFYGDQVSHALPHRRLWKKSAVSAGAL